tara:strand:+ start:592 stop:963 length:372 start_codon:yes stop_codon:yes gene_type:complete
VTGCLSCPGLHGFRVFFGLGLGLGSGLSNLPTHFPETVSLLVPFGHRFFTVLGDFLGDFLGGNVSFPENGPHKFWGSGKSNGFVGFVGFVSFCSLETHAPDLSLRVPLGHRFFLTGADFIYIV